MMFPERCFLSYDKSEEHCLKKVSYAFLEERVFTVVSLVGFWLRMDLFEEDTISAKQVCRTLPQALNHQSRQNKLS